MSELEPVLYSKFRPPDVEPDLKLVGEARPEDGVRICESEPGVVGEPAWHPSSAEIEVLRAMVAGW